MVINDFNLIKKTFIKCPVQGRRHDSVQSKVKEREFKRRPDLKQNRRRNDRFRRF